MKKAKQATLFSLKSWKNVASDSIKKYKNILDNPDGSDFEILKALVSLKERNLSKDVIFSAKLDVSLELLERHKNPVICHEACMLRNHLHLNKNCKPENIVINEEPPTKKRKTLHEFEICELTTIKEKVVGCKAQVIGNQKEKQFSGEANLMNINESVPFTDLKLTKPAFKSSSISKTTYNNVMRQLCDAVKLFTQELGEQEVRLYLETKSHIKH